MRKREKIETPEVKSDLVMRRDIGRIALGLVAGAAVLSYGGEDTMAADFQANATGKCATCLFWGGVRQISRDRNTVAADGKGWCNNPDSPAYRKLTNPDQGAPVWRKWDALDG